MKLFSGKRPGRVFAPSHIFSFIFLLLCLGDALSGKAQNFLWENWKEYSARDNAMYWKNHPPYAGYWQQDVSVHLKAQLRDTAQELTCRMHLLYVNNSPDTLKEMYFRLIQNAFIPGSYYDQLWKDNHQKAKFGPRTSEGKGTRVEQVLQGNVLLDIDLDNSIMGMRLAQPLLPGAHTQITIDFTTWFDHLGSMRRRMNSYRHSGVWHFNTVHWYPIPCVYDRKAGWNIEQHLDKEFYAQFGTYELELTLPAHYIVEASGNLLNEEQVLPAQLREAIDLKRFLPDSNGVTPRLFLPGNPSAQKTWHFKAQNVHNMAWTADPLYVMHDTLYQGVLVRALGLQNRAYAWRDARDFALQVLQVNQKYWGPYHWPKLTVADAKDGMEYPMLALCGGSTPGYKGLLAHEIGHMWYYGMVGSNEVYRAYLDEGITQFLTAWSLRQIHGDTLPAYASKYDWVNRHKIPQNPELGRSWLVYHQDAIKGQDPVLEQHSSYFEEGIRHEGGYRQVYYKTTIMLYQLHLVLGDSLFIEAMQHFFNLWAGAHPYPEDFRNAIIQRTGMDLNWLFDQWLLEDSHMDYKLTSVRKKKGRSQLYTVTLKRQGRMQSPVPVQVITETDTLMYVIPNRYRSPEVQADSLLPYWLGWGRFNRSYSFDVPASKKPLVVVDPKHQMADINRLNNTALPPLSWRWDYGIDQFADPYHYTLYSRPDIWYNRLDGLKLGMHTEAGYMEHLHQWSLGAWVHTGLGRDSSSFEQNRHTALFPLSYKLGYSTGFLSWPQTRLSLHSRYWSGIHFNGADWQIQAPGYAKNTRMAKLKIRLEFRFLYRDLNSLDYSYRPADWSVGQLNAWTGLNVNYGYKTGSGRGDFNYYLRNSIFFSDNQYGYVALEGNHLRKYAPGELRWRHYARFGSRAPRESALYIHGASPEERMDNKHYVAKGLIPSQPFGAYSGTEGPWMKGGLNLRGYERVMLDSAGILSSRVRSGTSSTLEYQWSDLLGSRLTHKKAWTWNSSLFSDLAFFSRTNRSELWEGGWNAGINWRAGISSWGPFDKAQPLVIGLDVPVILYTTETEFWQFPGIVLLSIGTQF